MKMLTSMLVLFFLVGVLTTTMSLAHVLSDKNALAAPDGLAIEFIQPQDCTENCALPGIEVNLIARSGFGMASLVVTIIGPDGLIERTPILPNDPNNPPDSLAPGWFVGTPTPGWHGVLAEAEDVNGGQACKSAMFYVDAD